MVDGWESAVEAQIRTAQERGDFDNLPGMGKPLPGRNDPYNELWWIKGFLDREELPTDVLLPASLQLRRKLEQVPGEIHDLPSEEAVRAYVSELNTQIVAWLRAPSGPQVVIRPLNSDRVVRQWHAGRQNAGPDPAGEQSPAGPTARPSRLWRLPWRRRH